MARTLTTIASTLVLCVASCGTHVPRPGEVVQTTAVSELHVTLPPGGLAPGDHVAIYRDIATGGRFERERKTLLGGGEVVRVDGDGAVVRPDPGVTVRSGDYAERR